MGILRLFLILIQASTLTWADDCTKLASKFKDPKQLMVVTTSGWDEKQGTLQRFERINKLDKWSATGEKIEVVVGKNGMGWGKDFAPLSNPNEPKKKEGDGKTPSGIFYVGTTFGFESVDGMDSPQRKHYRQLKDSTYCVDDQNSKYYNQIIDSVDPQITSNPPHNEKMRAEDLYKIGAEIIYPSSRKLGTGSCIFMHIWKDPTHGTAGCVAMEEAHIQNLVQWMNPKSKPEIALFPKEVYEKYKICLGLP